MEAARNAAFNESKADLAKSRAETNAAFTELWHKLDEFGTHVRGELVDLHKSRAYMKGAIGSLLIFTPLLTAVAVDKLT